MAAAPGCDTGWPQMKPRRIPSVTRRRNYPVRLAKLTHIRPMVLRPSTSCKRTVQTGLRISLAELISGVE